MKYSHFKRLSSNLSKLKRAIFRPIVRKYFEQAIAEFKTEALFEALFHAKSRDIIRAKVKKSFWCPGLYLLTANVMIKGNGKRKFKPGDKLLVRIDENMPDRIDVQRDEDGGDVFRLTEDEWISIRRKVELI